MVAKASPARRQAFLTALAASGNVTHAAARAKVSVSWAAKTRARDPEFRAAFDTALAEADARLRAARASSGLPKGMRFLDGEELVIHGGAGRRVMVRRAKLNQWTPSSERVFLERLSATCNVRRACAATGMGLTSAYERRQRSPDFGRRWQAALEEGYERLEMALIENALVSLDGAPAEPDERIERISFHEAVTLLKLHQRGAIGRGTATRPQRRATPAETDAQLVKALDRHYRVEAAKARKAGEQAARAGPRRARGAAGEEPGGAAAA